ALDPHDEEPVVILEELELVEAHIGALSEDKGAAAVGATSRHQAVHFGDEVGELPHLVELVGGAGALPDHLEDAILDDVGLDLLEDASEPVVAVINELVVEDHAARAVDLLDLGGG